MKFKKKYLTALTFPLMLTAFYVHAENYRYIIGGDPQAWRQESGDPNSKDNKAPWEALNKKVAASIAWYQHVVDGSGRKGIRSVIINGDITEFGRENTLNSYKEIYDKLPFPIYFGLGNHDYANNVNDCIGWGYPTSYNACALHMAVQLQAAVAQYKRNNPSANFKIDKSGDQYGKGSGSLAYSWDDDNLHFVQLNNYPTYSVHLDQWSGQWDLRITKSLDWLENDLSQAAAKGKHIIVNLHDANDHFIDDSTSSEKQRFKSILQKYNVVAVFAAHWHNAKEYSNKELYGDVPVFISGALFKGDYYLVETDAHGFSVDAYNGSTGYPEFKKHIKYIQFKNNQPGDNIVVNGDFQKGANGWTIKPNNWGKFIGIVQDKGSPSAYIESCSGGGLGGSILQTGIPVIPGRKYEVSYMSRTERRETMSGVMTRFPVNNNITINSSDYTQRKFTIEPEDNKTTIELTCNSDINAEDYTKGGAYFKNITVREIK